MLLWRFCDSGALYKCHQLLTYLFLVYTVKPQRDDRSHVSVKGKGKGKGKRGFVQHLVVNTPLRRSGMARVHNGSHSFSCTPRVHPLTE